MAKTRLLIGLTVGAGLLAALATGCRVERVAAGPKTEQTVSIYIPCGMLLPFHAALKQFEDENPGTKVEAKYDNSWILVELITKEGHRPDLYVSPGEQEAALLEREGMADPKARRTLGSYEVVLIVPKANPAGVRSLEDLRKPEVKHIAMGDPETNSVGYYARQSLRNLGLWDTLAPKMLLTEHPVESYAMVSQSKVDAAFSYLSCPLSSNPEKLQREKVQIIATMPRDSYDEANVVITGLKEGKNRKGAEKLMDFLLRPEIQALLAENGLPNDRMRTDKVEHKQERSMRASTARSAGGSA